MGEVHRDLPAEGDAAHAAPALPQRGRRQAERRTDGRLGEPRPGAAGQGIGPIGEFKVHDMFTLTLRSSGAIGDSEHRTIFLFLDFQGRQQGRGYPPAISWQGRSKRQSRRHSRRLDMNPLTESASARWLAAGSLSGACGAAGRGPSSWRAASAPRHSSAQPSDSRAAGPTSRGTARGTCCTAYADAASAT